jgi:hypothetical protein
MRTITLNQAIPVNTTPSRRSNLDGFRFWNASSCSRLRYRRLFVHASGAHERQSHRGDNSNRLHDFPRWENLSAHFLTLSESQVGLEGLLKDDPRCLDIPPQDREDRERYPPNRIGRLVSYDCQDNTHDNADKRDEIPDAKGHPQLPLMKSARPALDRVLRFCHVAKREEAPLGPGGVLTERANQAHDNSNGRRTSFTPSRIIAVPLS